MRTPVGIRTLWGAGWLAAAFLAVTLLPMSAQAQAPLPSVSGNLTLVMQASNQVISLNVQARIDQQGALLLPTGTILATVAGEGPTVFEVTGLACARIEVTNVIAGVEADITAVDRETDRTLRVRAFDEDAEAAKQLPADYHQPFPPGDCVIWLQIGDTVYESASLLLLPTAAGLEIKAPACEPGQ